MTATVWLTLGGSVLIFMKTINHHRTALSILPSGTLFAVVYLFIMTADLQYMSDVSCCTCGVRLMHTLRASGASLLCRILRLTLLTAWHWQFPLTSSVNNNRHPLQVCKPTYIVSAGIRSTREWVKDLAERCIENNALFCMVTTSSKHCSLCI